ncbi:restriction endonuclease subunit S [Faecalibacterium sp. 9]|uniref:restriction endonuclease subunit S n=1 Tax=Faecalibacterium sp. 9 TaxID=3402018 RepID=UPI003AAAACE6
MARKMKDSGIEWIGEIPEGWEVTKLKYLSTFPIEKNARTDSPYIGLENIESWTGKYVSSDSQYDKSQALAFFENNILFGKLRPYLAKVFCASNDGCCSSEFCILNFSSSVNIRYFWNLLISPTFIDHVTKSTYGTKMPRANTDFIKNICVPVPPRIEQDRIALYLDATSAKIDSLISETRSSIEEYKKLKQAVITQAVTKGVRGEREMKDSGVEWAGLVPHYWGVAKIGSIGQTSSGATPLRSKEASFFDDAAIRWVRTLDLNDGLVYDSSEKITELALASSACSIMPKGTVCVAMYGGAGTIGKCGLLMSDCATNQAVCSIVCNREIVSPIFLLMQLLALKSYWMKYAVGTRKDPNISQDVVARMKILIPPLDEQKEITDYLDAKCAEIDKLIAKKEQLVKELESYKKSLIYEVVTGKREV